MEYGAKSIFVFDNAGHIRNAKRHLTCKGHVLFECNLTKCY